MKGLPNLVTAIRAAASGALIFAAPFSAALRFVPAAAAAPFLFALAAFAAAQECGSVCRMSGVFRGALRRKK